AAGPAASYGVGACRAATSRIVRLGMRGGSGVAGVRNSDGSGPAAARRRIVGPVGMTLGVVLFVVAVVAVGGSGLVLLVTAHRLDRLHVRLDAAWAALDRALVDRAALAVATAETAPRTDVVARLHPAAVRAELAPRV